MTTSALATRHTLHALVPGLAVAAGLALAAGWMAGGLGEPLARNPVLVAMLFGLLLGNCFTCSQTLRPGLDFTKRQLLRLGVMLLGFRITVALLAELGWVPIAIAATELMLTLWLVNTVARRVFGLERGLALLIAAGSAVCGAAAILAVAALTREREQQAGVAIALITVAGTLSLLLYPVAFLGGWMPGLDEQGFGIMVGASIFELAQVYGASYAVSEGALNTATLVKLSKVVMLIPLLVGLAFAQRRKAANGVDAAGKTSIPVPWFVVGFIGVLLFNSAFTVHPVLRQLILEFDQFLFLMVMVSLGLTTPLSRLHEGAGAWQLVGTGLLAALLCAALAYGLVRAGSAHAQPAEPLVALESPAMLSHDGGRLFASVGCAKCHVESLPSASGPVRLYSDLLLHDMGPGLDDKIVQGEATGADWRTTPLAGLSLRQRYLHDGRATTIRDAVLAHGGEAEIVRRRFFELDDADRLRVYQFLSAL